MNKFNSGSKSTTTNNGYKYIIIKKPDHYRANCGWVKEHVLVAEKILGRSLKPEECVFHANGITTDSRKENLRIAKNFNEFLKMRHYRNAPYVNADERMVELRFLYKIFGINKFIYLPTK